MTGGGQQTVRSEWAPKQTKETKQSKQVGATSGFRSVLTNQTIKMRGKDIPSHDFYTRPKSPQPGRARHLLRRPAPAYVRTLRAMCFLLASPNWARASACMSFFICMSCHVMRCPTKTRTAHETRAGKCYTAPGSTLLPAARA